MQNADYGFFIVKILKNCKIYCLNEDSYTFTCCCKFGASENVGIVCNSKRLATMGMRTPYLFFIELC